MAAAITVALAVVAGGCERAAGDCRPIPAAPEAAHALTTASAGLDFTPVSPCAFRSQFVVTRVLTDVLPGETDQLRVSFVVTHGDAVTFTLSETRALQPFRAIPQGTHALHAEAAGVSANGFVGASGSGGELAYLRWRTDAVTYELAATLGTWLTADDVQAIARAMIVRAASEH